MSAPEDRGPLAVYWDELIRDQAEQALAEADALDEKTRRDRWTTAVREAECVATRHGSGYWTGQT